jgi:hypothetical protein
MSCFKERRAHLWAPCMTSKWWKQKLTSKILINSTLIHPFIKRNWNLCSRFKVVCCYSHSTFIHRKCCVKVGVVIAVTYMQMMVPRWYWPCSPTSIWHGAQHHMVTNGYNTCFYSATPSPPEHGHATSCQPHELKPYKCTCWHNKLQSPIWVHAPKQAPSPPALLYLVLGFIHNRFPVLLIV